VTISISRGNNRFLGEKNLFVHLGYLGHGSSDGVRLCGAFVLFGRFLMASLLSSFLSSEVVAQEEIELWAGQEIPFAKENDLREFELVCWGGNMCADDITVPTLSFYPAKENPSGKAVLVIPGGGYNVVAVSYEGHDTAKALAERGISAGVLKYRLPDNRHSTNPQMTPLTDARRALAMMRDRADELGIQDSHVGVLGYSAGAHLATLTGLWRSDDSNQNASFSILIYGVTRLTKSNQDWLEKSAYHRPLTEREIAKNTLLDLVNEETPPAFLVHAMDDDVCHYTESTYYAERLTEHGVEMEMHLFPAGGHGFGLGLAEDGTDQWMDLAANWVRRLN
jgi:acetyl esterase/lipase